MKFDNYEEFKIEFISKLHEIKDILKFRSEYSKMIQDNMDYCIHVLNENDQSLAKKVVDAILNRSWRLNV